MLITQKKFGPIRGQYSGHMICLIQSEASIYSHLRRDVLWGPEDLMVAELLGLLVNVALIEVSGQGHETHLA